jgi:methyl-accepting chemotaxis protein
MNIETLLIAAIAVIGLAVVLQTIILLAIYISMRKTVRALNDEVEELKSTITPLVGSVRDFIARISPKIESAVDDVSEMARSARAQSAGIQASVAEILKRTQNQLYRFDDMATSALDCVDRAGNLLIETVNKPVRQISAVLSMVKAVVDSLRSPAPRRRDGAERF